MVDPVSMVLFDPHGVGFTAAAMLVRPACIFLNKIIRWFQHAFDRARHPEARVWKEYKDAREGIMCTERDDYMRHIRIQDLRQEMKIQYPGHAHLWN